MEKPAVPNTVLPHEDDKINMFRLAAMAAMGIYLYKAFKKEGSLSTATMGKLSEFNINTDKLVDSVMPWVNVPPEKRPLVEAGAKEFLLNLKQQLLKKDK